MTRFCYSDICSMKMNFNCLKFCSGGGQATMTREHSVVLVHLTSLQKKHFTCFYMLDVEVF